MKGTAFRQIVELINMRENLEHKIGDFVENNLKNILNDIIKDGKSGVRNVEYLYYIPLDYDYLLIVDGDVYTATYIDYNTKDGDVYIETDSEDYINFSDIEPNSQLDLMSMLMSKFF